MLIKWYNFISVIKAKQNNYLIHFTFTLVWNICEGTGPQALSAKKKEKTKDRKKNLEVHSKCNFWPSKNNFSRKDTNISKSGMYF